MSAVTASPGLDAASLAPRDVLRTTWVLFQHSWASGLPLALVGVTASSVPGAEAAARGAHRGFSHDPQWWGLYVASMTLMLLCYGALLVRQASIASGAPLPVMDCLRTSGRALPATLICAVAATLGVSLGLVLLVLPGLALAVLLSFAWLAVLREGADPIQALRRSVQLARPQLLSLAGAYAAALAAVVVFVLLAGIFVAVFMAIAGQQGPTSVAGLTVSRLLFGAVLALPVIYIGAVLVVCYRTVLAQVPQR